MPYKLWWYVNVGPSVIINILVECRMLTAGEAMHVQGEGFSGNSLHHVLYFTLNTKLLFNVKSTLKRIIAIQFWNLILNIFKETFFFPFIFISWRLITLQYCSGFCHTMVHWEDPEGRVEREVGSGIRMGNTCKSMADSCQCMTKKLLFE